jgi:hypothetical protein
MREATSARPVAQSRPKRGAARRGAGTGAGIHGGTIATSRAFRARPRSWEASPRSWEASPRSWEASPQSWEASPRSWEASPHRFGASPRSWEASPHRFGASPRSWESRIEHEHAERETRDAGRETRDGVTDAGQGPAPPEAGADRKTTIGRVWCQGRSQPELDVPDHVQVLGFHVAVHSSIVDSDMDLTGRVERRRRAADIQRLGEAG